MNPIEIARAIITSHGGDFLASMARRIRMGIHATANNNSGLFILYHLNRKYIPALGGLSGRGARHALFTVPLIKSGIFTKIMH